MDTIDRAIRYVNALRDRAARIYGHQYLAFMVGTSHHEPDTGGLRTTVAEDVAEHVRRIMG